MADVERIAVIGAGAWGTALAQVAGARGRSVLLWAREPAVVHRVNTARENRQFLPGIALDAGIRATDDLTEAADGADVLLLVVPAQHMRAVAARLPPTAAPLVIGAKGFEQTSGALMTEVVAEATSRQGLATDLAVLSGPSFADEVARGLPTAITLACAEEAIGMPR